MDNNPQNKNKSQAEGSSDSIKADHAKRASMKKDLARRK